MSYFRSWDQSFRCYKELRVVDDMNDSGSYELKPLDLMNCLELWMIVNDSPSWAQAYRCCELLKLWMTWMTLSRELRTVDVINNSGLWITWMPIVHEIRPLYSMNNSGLWLTRKTLSCELRLLDIMHNLRLSMTRKTPSREWFVPNWCTLILVLGRE